MDDPITISGNTTASRYSMILKLRCLLA